MSIENTRAPSVEYFTPKQPLPSGTVLGKKNDKIPPLFSELKIKGMTIPNRIGLSPMCMYSADNGFPTPFHMIHYNTYSMRGTGLIILESVAVTSNGRISPNDLGIWTDEQAYKLKEIVDFAHSQGKKIGIQLSHSGRKASTLPLYTLKFDVSTDKNFKGDFSDDVWSSSDSFETDDKLFKNVKKLNINQVKEIILKFGEAAKRCYEICKFDFIEIHAAHGYLINQFLSQTTNKRGLGDEYSGLNFETRIKFLIDIVNTIKSNINTDEIPIFVRLSASENNDDNENAWTFNDTLKLIPILIKNGGIDVFDISSGGNSPVKSGKQLSQLEMAKQVKCLIDDLRLTSSLGDKIYVAAVGNINNAKLANDLISENNCDIVLVGREFLKSPNLVENWAHDLNTNIQMTLQYGWPL
ncbi:unnamed protein product [[Candida] boidinii]|uniref:Unnamed protein product n=1 Tax=Candida boidinii TaxID=5477 RepID=A0A9W6SUJ4_CANBO|nr:catalytic activity protein [[Candida] boidinii]GME67489.1 unnamed protein product [[Candida] boidinii]GMG00237.1 unnamed protein product [[Candida] boidinii]